MANKHELWELQSMQAAPLAVKIRMTERRIQDWIDYYGEDGVAISFSGGKDSTVLMDIIRNRMGYKNIPAVFVDVPTQYPELKEFALTWDNVEVLKPKVSFMQVCEKYGFPLISKEVSESVEGARKYLTQIKSKIASLQTDRQTDRQTDSISTPISTIESVELANILNERLQNKKGGNNQRLAIMMGWYTNKKTIQVNIPDEDRSRYSFVKWKFTLDAPFEISNKCCNAMKKEPAHTYYRKTGRKPITAQMADESRLRTQQWIKNGCNGFDMKNPISNPMSFWVEQDVLLYIKENNLPICSVYGDIVEDWDRFNGVEGQMTISDIKGFEDCGIFDAERPLLKTTGCKRTGCMLCGFGCHLEKPGEGRFELLKQTHPQMYALLDVVKNNGVTMREAIEWVNENGNLNIKL